MMRAGQSFWLAPLIMVASCNVAPASTNQSEVERRVTAIVATHFDIAPSSITANSHFYNDPKADSLDFVELVMAFEEEFAVIVDDAAAEKMCTVGAATRYIESMKK